MWRIINYEILEIIRTWIGWLITRKVNKILSQILLEDIDFSGAELNLIIKSMRKLKDHADDFLSRYDEENDSNQYNENLSQEYSFQ